MTTHEADSTQPQLPATDQRLSILIPVYQGEKTIGPLVDTIVETLGTQINLWEIILVNDGSPDNSHGEILRALDRHPEVVRYVRLYRNFGEHNAVMCGLNQVTGDCVVIIDDDFQNPPSEIVKLVVALYTQDVDVVYSYYESKKHSLFRNLGSIFNDRVATFLLGKPRHLYLSSFKAIRADLVKLVVQYQGPYPYIDGLILRSTNRIGRQLCRHDPRARGKSSYTLNKLIHLWLNMSTGFSITPLRVAAYLGMASSALAFLLMIYFTLERIRGPIIHKIDIPPGWASLIVAITFFAGLQLSVMGLMGEYLGRLFLTINGQPQYLIRDAYGIEEKGKDA
jgi:undecaprenyl-phosphate 4-deoxy-4-formamido-L-arabinose transferase